MTSEGQHRAATTPPCVLLPLAAVPPLGMFTDFESPGQGKAAPLDAGKSWEKGPMSTDLNLNLSNLFPYTSVGTGYQLV
jgi:hypothetical protein